jgi:hypothetical protein
MENRLTMLTPYKAVYEQKIIRTLVLKKNAISLHIKAEGNDHNID